MTTPMFTPDGRLLQVEYAGQATTHSFPLIAITLQTENDENEEDVMIVATLLSSPRAEREEPNGNIYTEDDKSKNQSKQITRAQRRIINIPIGPPKITEGNNSNSGGLIMGVSGVLSDNVALLKQVQNHMESWYRQYGMHKPHSSTSETTSNMDTSNGNSATSAALRIANTIGDACQQNSFGGGIRPFGASTLICAMESKCTPSKSSRWVMYTTYPSGSILKHSPNENRHSDNSSMNIVVVGGETTLQQTLQNQIETNVQTLSSESNISISSLAKAIIVTLCDQYEKQMDDKVYLTKKKDVNCESTNTSLENINSMLRKLRSNQNIPFMEIAIVSPHSGVQDLEQSDIHDIIDLILDSSSSTLEG